MSSGSAVRSTWRSSGPPSAVRAIAGQRALAHDHRVHELHRHVAGVRARLGRRARGQQAAAALEPLRHLPAQPGQRIGLLREPGHAWRVLAAEGVVDLVQQPVAEALHPLAGLGAALDDLGVGVHRADVGPQLVQVVVQVGQQVDLVHHHQLAGAEHQRVLQRLVLALGDRAHHGLGVLAHAELGRADQVAHVLDHQQVDPVQRQVGQRGAHHVGVQVALAAEAAVGVQLHHRHVQRGQPVGVQAALHVALQHAHAHVAHVAEHASSSVVLPAPGARHQVHHGHRLAVEVGPVGVGDRGVRVQGLLGHLHLGAVHAASSLLHVDRLHEELLPGQHLHVRAAAAGAAEDRAGPASTPAARTRRRPAAPRRASCASARPRTRCRG